MGSVIDPSVLTASGERCIARLTELVELRLPPAQLVTAIGTVVEVHVSGILAQLTSLSHIDEHQLGQAMLRRLQQEMNKSWASRAEWFKDGFSVAYKGRKAAQYFDVLVELRNAVVHGDGAASEQQAMKGTASLARMRRLFADRLNVEFRGQVEFAPTSAALAMDIARQFVADFDQMVLARFPETMRLGR